MEVITIEKLEEYRKIAKRFEEKAEAETKAFFEMAKFRAEVSKNELKARIESGLVDPQKLEKYHDWKESHKIEFPKREIDPEDLKKAYDEHLAKLIEYRNISNTRAYLYSSIGDTILLTNPNTSFSSSGFKCDPEDPITKSHPYLHTTASDATTGNVTKLFAKAWAMGDYDWDTKILTTATASAWAQARFYYEIPPDFIPEYGGTIRVTPKLNIFGEYKAHIHYEDNFAHTDQLHADLNVGTHVMPEGNYPGKSSPFLMSMPNFPIESKYQGYGWYDFYEYKIPYATQQPILGPTLELDVVGKGKYTVIILIQLNSRVETSYTWNDPAYATCDFELKQNYIQVEDVLVEIVGVNPPPPKVYHYEPSPGEKYGWIKKPPINPGPYEYQPANP